jgi:hypothetical protein
VRVHTPRSGDGHRAHEDADAAGLQVFGWDAETERAGFAQNAMYLVRPDGYVALASAGSVAAAAMCDYLSSWKIGR